MASTSRTRTLATLATLAVAVLAGCGDGGGGNDGNAATGRAQVYDVDSEQFSLTVAVTDLEAAGLTWNETAGQYESDTVGVRFGASTDFATFDTRADAECEDWQRCLVELAEEGQSEDGIEITVEEGTDEHGNDLVRGESVQGSAMQVTVLKKLGDTFVICEAVSTGEPVVPDAVRDLCESMHDLQPAEEG